MDSRVRGNDGLAPSPTLIILFSHQWHTAFDGDSTRSTPTKPDPTERAPVEAHIIDKGIPTAGLLAQVLVGQRQVGKTTGVLSFV
jgi:hypothetical protein